MIEQDPTQGGSKRHFRDLQSVVLSNRQAQGFVQLGQIVAVRSIQRLRHHGTIQLVVSPQARGMNGRWLGFGKNFIVNSGDWHLD
jgi:hypothetical protein